MAGSKAAMDETVYASLTQRPDWGDCFSDWGTLAPFFLRACCFAISDAIGTGNCWAFPYTHTHCCSFFNLAVVVGLEDRAVREGVGAADAVVEVLLSEGASNDNVVAVGRSRVPHPFALFSEFRDPSLTLSREQQWAGCARALTHGTGAEDVLTLATDADKNLVGFNRCCRAAGELELTPPPGTAPPSTGINGGQTAQTHPLASDEETALMR